MRREIKMSGYDAFVCLADRCPFTCCQQWKISVDPDTKARWLREGRAAALCRKDGADVIRLDGGMQCPYLNEEKLCRLVLSQGEDAIPETCRVFPRQVHRFADRTEYALVTCCPEVVDGLAEAAFVREPEEVSAGSGTAGRNGCEVVRDWMIERMQEGRYSAEKTGKVLFYVLLALRDQPEERLAEGLRDCLASEAELAEAIDGVPVSEADSFAEINELFLDVTENYRREGLYRAQLEPLMELAESWEKAGADAALLREWSGEFRRELEPWEDRFRKVLACEFFADLLLPETGIREMLLMTQWIFMEYALLRHGLFLMRQRKGDPLAWDEIRDWIVVLARMTGYDLADIEEYLENSFDSPVWEWGYLALLLPE